MKGMLASKYREVVLGHAEIRQTFQASGIGTIAGCYVQEGKIVRASKVRIVRDGIVIHEGELASLKRFKDDVREVAAGYECGMNIERFNDLKVGDIIEAFTLEEFRE
jgi:translation initiation factor IF-2